jgi:hypothetical protein
VTVDARSDRGTVTAFVVSFAIALLAVGGLVLDGGYLLAARERAYDEADAAARAGAQAIDVDALRSGGPATLSVTDVEQRVDDYLRASGREGAVEVHGDQVTVTITQERSMVLLGAFGVGPVTIEATGTASAVQAVEDEDVEP